MKIAVHAKVLSETQLTGIGVYTYNLLLHLSRIDRENEYVLFTNEPLVHKIEAPNFREHLVDFKRFWSYLALPWELRKGKFDLLFVPKEFVPPYFRPKTVITVYDLMGLPFASKISLEGRVHFQIAVRYAIPSADGVLTISGETRKNVLEKCHVRADRVKVTHLGYDQEVFRVPTGESWKADVRRKYGLPGPYFINTSSLLWYRKNLVRLVEAFAKVRGELDETGLKLVITGKKGEAYGDILEAARRTGLGDALVLTGYIPLEDMPHLLAASEGLVFPSLDEGFGLPLIEAMACGCPVISSNRSAIPEVVGDAALLVDPEDVGALAKAMKTFRTDRDLWEDYQKRGLRRAAGFSWERCAKETLAFFQQVASSP